MQRKDMTGLFEQLRTGINIIVAAVSGKSGERLSKLYKRHIPGRLCARIQAELLLQNKSSETLETYVRL